MAINEMNKNFNFKMVKTNRYWFVIVTDKKNGETVRKVRYNTENAARYGIFYMGITMGNIA